MATISPGDAEVALRTFPRRWDAAVGGLDEDDPDTGAVVRHPGPDGRSAAACAAEAAAILEVADGHVRRAVSSDRPTLEPPAPPAEAPVAESLRRIGAAAPAMADTVAAVAAGDLDREAELGNSTVRVRTLISDAVERVAALLRSAQDAVRAGRASIG